MNENPQIPSENPKNKPYEEKTPDDLCPEGKSKRKIKNCDCDDCKGFRETVPKETHHKTPEQTPKELAPLLMNRRTALGAIITGAALGGWMKLKGNEIAMTPEKTPIEKLPEQQPQKTPDVIPPYERSFEVQGVKIELDDSWEMYAPPEGKSISDLFKAEFERLVTFYKKWKVDLKGRTFRFAHDPSLFPLGKVQFQFQHHGKPAPDTNFFNEKNELIPLYLIAKNTTPDPIPIKIRFYRGSTIAHEVFHTLHGPYLGQETLWQEGLAEAVEKLYEKDYPETAHFSVRHSTSEIEQEKKAMSRREAIFENHDVERIFRNLKWDDTWDLEEVKDENSTTELVRYVARNAWLEWIQNHPDFLGRFIQRIELDNYWYTKPHEAGRKENERLIFIGNSACMRYAAERLYPEEFRAWYDRQTIFAVPTAGDRILLAYSYGAENKCGIIATKRVAKPNSVPSNTVMRTQLVPVPIFVLLKNGLKAKFESKSASFEIDIPREQIAKITDLDGNEIPFVN